MKVFAGTSGFSFPEWKGSFYPERIKPDQMLGYYAERLGVVEINNTFYRMPKTSVLEGWATQVPDDFRFVLKASQKITHIARLKDTADNVAYLCQQAQALGPKLGPILFQTPPNLKRDDDRLARFLADLPAGLPCALEMRHPSWSDPAVLELVRSHGACSWCTADVDDAPEPEVAVTARFAYVRLRREAYDEARLVAWLERLRAAGLAEAYVFFKHEDGGIGPKLAQRFVELAGD
jgi:uncharacterized protein YecE (DUF72 family)